MDREASLAQSLLHDDPTEGEGAGRRWAYPGWAMLLISLFIAYHATILIVFNLPRTGLSADLHRAFSRNLEMRDYLRTVGTVQSWSMFAPNPHRRNEFMQVLVVDAAGEVWDMQLDIYGRDRYPYLFYDRIGKINRRIIDERNYRRHFAAWVCRHWERTHDGESAQEVRFVKRWTRVPKPEEVFEHADGHLGSMWFDPKKLPLKSHLEETLSCSSTRQAQLPPYLRERFGFPPAEPTHYRPAFMRTWKDKLGSEEESRRRLERKQKIGAPPVEREVFR